MSEFKHFYVPYMLGKLYKSVFTVMPSKDGIQ
jgi:hypothetical protein